MSDLITINTNGLDEAIRCAICENPIKSERGCDGSCQYDKEMLSKVIDAVKGLAAERPHGEWEQVGEMKYKCTRCGWIKNIGLMPYCENCGADMRKEGEASD